MMQMDPLHASDAVSSLVNAAPDMSVLATSAQSASETATASAPVGIAPDLPGAGAAATDVPVDDMPVAAALGVILVGGSAVFLLGSVVEGIIGAVTAAGQRGLLGGMADVAATGAGADAVVGTTGGAEMAASAAAVKGLDSMATGVVDASAGATGAADAVMGAADAVVGSMEVAESATIAAGSQVAEVASSVVDSASSVVEAADGLVAASASAVTDAGLVAPLNAGLEALSASLAALAGLATVNGVILAAAGGTIVIVLTILWVIVILAAAGGTIVEDVKAESEESADSPAAPGES